MLALLSGSRASARAVGRHASGVLLRGSSSYVGRHRHPGTADRSLVRWFLPHRPAHAH